MIDTYFQFLPVAVCLFWAVLLFLRRKTNAYSQNVLAALLFVRGISFLSVFPQVSGKVDTSEYLLFDIIDTLFTPLFFPLVYIYFRSVTVGKDWRIFDYLIFVPAVMLGLFNITIYMLVGFKTGCLFVNIDFGNIVKGIMNAPDREIYGLHYLVSVVFYNVLISVEILAVGVYAAVSTWFYHRRIKEFYSNLEGKSILSDNSIIQWTLLGILMSFIFILPGRSFWIKNETITTAFYALWSVVYFGWGLLGYRKEYTVENLNADLEESDALEAKQVAPPEFADGYCTQEREKGHSGITSDRHVRLHAMFVKLIDEERIFCRTDLRIDTLARYLFTNRLYVSQMIREHYGHTFSDYINRKRVKYAMQLLREQPCIKLEDLAEKTGFINAQTLSRAFKQLEGIPPKEWSRKHKTA